MIDRRSFIGAIALIVFTAPLAAEAQQAGKVWRIGVLLAGSDPAARTANAIRQGLHEFGYVEGQNIAIEWRMARGRPERLPEFATDLVRLNVDVIVASTNRPVRAAQQATKTIPIVMVSVTDPVGSGFVGTFPRPGGNTTGLSLQTTELVAKRLQLLKETLPALSRVAVLWNPSEPGRLDQVREVQTAASAFGIQVCLVEARDSNELEDAFAAMTKEGLRAVLVVGDPWMYTHKARMAELAARSRVSTFCSLREYAQAGCLMSYGVSSEDAHRRAARYIERIIRGTSPADLPVELPTKFDLVINLKTAKELGLSIPQSLLLRADQVIDP